ncbi:MAG: tripartite tricarboxylate transporter TctB family protein [Cyanobacteria bacterium J06638_20]
MTCQIEISIPTGQTTPGQGLSTLIISGTATDISGTATDCSTVRVRVTDTLTNIVTPEKDTTVTNGQWSVEFTVEEGDFPAGTFRCGRENKYLIDVACKEGDSCKTTLSDELIECEITPCPDVTLTITPGDCANGLLAVALKAEVVSANDATYTWFFGTDEDNQLGEDSQGGGWLPEPDNNGIRVVETTHLYAPTAETQTVTVRFETSTGPNSTCVETQIFSLAPCPCDFSLSLSVLDSAGDVIPPQECLPSGSYTVQISATPAESDITYLWFVNNESEANQNDATLNVSIAPGEEKTVAAFAKQGNCIAIDEVMIRGCPDCSRFDVQLQVVDSNLSDVTSDSCLTPGVYTVQAIVPDEDVGTTFTWWIDDNLQEIAMGGNLQVTLGSDEPMSVVVEASQNGCRDIASAALVPCPPPPPPDSEDDRDPTPVIIPFCQVFAVLLLIGVGILGVGLGLLLCPMAASPLIPVQYALIVGGGLAIVGFLIVLLILGLMLFFNCDLGRCFWWKMAWQVSFLIGVCLFYTFFCPACVWMIAGALLLVFAAWAFWQWRRRCNPSICLQFAELLWVMIAFDIAALLEVVLASCVITSNQIGLGIWFFFVLAFNLYVMQGLRSNNCIPDANN